MRLPALLLSMLAFGCGTVTHGPRDTLFVDSKPSGADASITCDGDFRAAGTTPAKLTLPRRSEHCVLTVERAGSKTQRLELDQTFSSRFWWNFAIAPAFFIADRIENGGGDAGYAILIAPFATGAAFLVDQLTGSKHNYEPNEIVVELEPNP